MKRWRWLIAAIIVVGGAAAVYMLKPVNGPARDLTLTADATRGEYVLRLAGCVACHTDAKNEGAMLAGGAPLETPFGSFVPPNITPHPEAGIGRWTLAQFSAAMSDGEGPQGHLYPAFPYDNYTLMSDQDLVDLYAALMAVEPVAEPAPPHDVGFPFNIRLAMAGWKNLFFSPRRFEPDPSRSERWNRGAYLVNGPAHCTACHTPRNLLGGPDHANALEGSSGTPGGNVPAITAEELADDDYDIASLADALESGFTPGFDILGGPMGEVIAEGTAHWTAEDREAVAAYLFDED